MKTLLYAALITVTFTSYAQKVETIVSKDDVIWGFDFLPDGKIIFTERSGSLYTYDPKTKKTEKIEGTPKVYAEGQGGLLDVRVHPKNNYIYLTYSIPVGKDKSTTAAGRGKLSGGKLTDFKQFFKAEPAREDDIHYGSRVEFSDDGHIYVSVGERGSRMLVQELDNHLGKIVRLKADGSVPKDNPFVKNKKAKPEIYNYGHRNSQGLSMRPDTSELWEAEMGPKGGDEVNIMRPGENYGWPVVTYGTEYHGPKIGEGTSRPGMVQPVEYWVPSISPSGMTFYNGDKIPEWKGNLFLANLSGQHIRRLKVAGKEITEQEELFKDKGWRFRQLRPGPDGYLWYSTDEGKLGRITK